MNMVDWIAPGISSVRDDTFRIMFASRPIPSIRNVRVLWKKHAHMYVFTRGLPIHTSAYISTWYPTNTFLPGSRRLEFLYNDFPVRELNNPLSTCWKIPIFHSCARSFSVSPSLSLSLSPSFEGCSLVQGTTDFHEITCPHIYKCTRIMIWN